MEEKSFFNKLWLWSFLGMAATYIIQIIVVKVFQYINPKIFDNPTIAFLLPMLSAFLIGYPILIFCINRIPTSINLEKNKLKVWHIILAVIFAYGIIIVSNLMGTMITSFLAKIIGKEISVVLEDALGSGANFYVLAIVLAVLAPLYEEYIFRKLLIDRLAGYGEKLAILLSAFVFALFHGNLGQAIYAFCVGLFLGYVYIRTGKIIYSTIIHMSINFLGSVFPLILRQFIDIGIIQDYSAKGDIAGLSSYIMNNTMGMILLVIQETLVFGAIILLVVMLIVLSVKKQFFFIERVEDVPKGKRFNVSMVNAGMLLIILFFGSIIVMQIVGC